MNIKTRELRNWRNGVDRYFAFLSEYGFMEDRGLAASGSWTTQVVWRSTELAIEITKSREFRRVELTLLRLVRGEIPDFEIFFDPEVPMNRTLLDNVLVARGVDECHWPTGGLKKPDIERQLSRWAELLKGTALDLLEGSTAAFEEAKEVVARRTEETPQEIVVWLPESASAEEEVHAVAQAAEQAPENVAVVARRYRR